MNNFANMYGAFHVILYFVIIQLCWLLINLLLILSDLILSYPRCNVVSKINIYIQTSVVMTKRLTWSHHTPTMTTSMGSLTKSFPLAWKKTTTRRRACKCYIVRRMWFWRCYSIGIMLHIRYISTTNLAACVCVRKI